MLSAVRSSRVVRGSLLLLVVLCGNASADVTPQAGMLRYPDISAEQICFVYAGDIWVAPRDGGMASPLASPPGQESFPRFSPDGKTIAFVGNYDGNRDLYTIPVTGGIPTRVTYHPGAETLSDWTPDGRLLFLTNAFAGLGRQSQLFTVSAEGGMPRQVPVPYAGFGSISPDGSTLAYTLHSTDTRTWKRYRGGMATDVWLFNLKDLSSKQITDWEGTDTIPMWVPGGDGKVVYYLSDNGPEHRLNIWSYEIASGRRAQVTKYTEHDVRWPSVGPGPRGRGEIIFQLGSELRVLDLANGRDRVVTVTIPGQRPTIRTRLVDASRNVGGTSISSTGRRVAIEGRGDIWSAPAKEGVVRNLTATDGVFERDPAWSPDNRWIAYFSDESGEYELYIRASDSRGEEKEGESDEAEAEQRETRRLTNLGPGFRYSPNWSPDSKHIAFTDKAGRLLLTTVETGETRELDKDPWGTRVSVSWSHDSKWMAYALTDDVANQRAIWLYNLGTDEKTRVTTPMFSSTSPTFDRKGDFLYFASSRAISGPMYSDIDTTFIYAGTEQLFMVPLREDVKNPWLPKSDEEEIKKEKKKEDAKPGEKREEKTNDKAEAVDDGLSGTWEGASQGEGLPPGGLPFTMTLKLSNGNVTGSILSMMGGGGVSGTFEKSAGNLTITISLDVGGSALVSGTVKGEEFSGTWSAGDGSGTITARRTAKSSPPAEGEKGKDEKPDAKDSKAKELKIDLEGFERRAMALPVPAGNFGRLEVTHDGKLIYARVGSRGSREAASIKIFDPNDESREEKTVTAGANFEISADGKKLLVRRGGASLTVMDAAAGGPKSSNVVTTGMRTPVNPRNEWRQIFMDTYRLHRDFFYEDTLHGVNWEKVRDQYMAMLEDCIDRSDVAWVQAEFVSELNIGHAYISSPGDVESGPPSVSVGLLGCDFELVSTDAGAAYRIVQIYEGAPWDSDARGPLSQPGVKVKVGDYILAVNGRPIDTSKDIYAAFLDTAERVTSITVSESPTLNARAREVIVRPTSSESNLRYRAWIERNRKHVYEKSGGRIGYIYVPNTGIDGQSDLFRQFVGQRNMDALVIDERWNGGGQIPTRFIELLNRPAVNMWARRDGKDWVWPPDGHNGPKAMLINGLAGSGGDAFPWLFRYHELGKLIGTRTWGGLVGISGNPGLIDGGAITVPTFGFYKMDGNWGVEGHGVDPDIEVIDDPAKMVNGGDPQLDVAVEHLLEELKTKAWTRPQRPAGPDRSGMGIPEHDR